LTVRHGRDICHTPRPTNRKVPLASLSRVRLPPVGALVWILDTSPRFRPPPTLTPASTGVALRAQTTAYITR
jgi:hypothetical protein